MTHWTKSEDKILLGLCLPNILRKDIAKNAYKSGELNRTPTAIENRLGIINRKWQANFKPIKAISGCHMEGCKSDAVGKFCEDHARAGFPRNMTPVYIGVA